MAVTFTTSGKTSNASATTSMAFTAFATTATQKLCVGITLADNTKTVTSITDTAGNLYLFSYGQNQTGVRSELWVVSSLIANASNVITVNFSGAVLASGAYGEYAGATGFQPPPFTTNGNSVAVGGSGTNVGANDWQVAFFGVATNSGDTLTATQGNLRQSMVPALTSVSTFLMDNTSTLSGTVPIGGNLNTARFWSAVVTGLTSGQPALSVTAENIRPPTSADSYSQHQVVKTPSTSQSILSGTSNTGFLA